MRTERKNAIRQSIIDTASRLFYAQGYVNTGINQIIDESGLSNHRYTLLFVRKRIF